MQREIDPREEVIVHMRWLINYIRSCFCNHEWECLQNEMPVYESPDKKYPIRHEWVYRCKKCCCKKVIKV